MKRISFAIGLVLLSSALVAAQSMTPAQEVKKFDVMIGSWEGSGVGIAPDKSTINWTSKSNIEWTMNHHFVREDLQVNVEGLPPMYYRSYYGWDAAQKRYVAYTVSNTGTIQVPTQISWIGDNQLVIAGTENHKGMPKLSRWIADFSGDSFSFKEQEAIGASELATVVEGTLKKSSTPFKLPKDAFKSSLAAAPVQMAKLYQLCGDYTMSGEMTHAPGTPAQKISANETVRKIFGGSMIEFETTGDPMGDFVYEGVHYIGWDPAHNCYREIYVNNMGESSDLHLRWDGEHKLVSTHAGIQAGQPVAVRGTLHLDKAGSIEKASMDRLLGDHKPERAFIGEYEKKK